MMDIIEEIETVLCDVKEREGIDAILYDAKCEIERLREALQSIANNTCCDTCQEAALVARAALKGTDNEN